MSGRAIARRVDALERAMPPTDHSTLTDAELEARLIGELEAWRAAERLALADPSSTPARRTQAEDALRVVAEILA